jgi:hypothetical protein
MGEVCPHGRHIVLVDGTHVRNVYDSDFSQGGNGYRYRFVPKGELWIDREIAEAEWPFIAFHECEESELMKSGRTYDSAHLTAKRDENRLRRATMSPEEWLSSPDPLCPVCGQPSPDVTWRKDPREWLPTFGMPTFVSCGLCYQEAREDN